jgi:hypothetical protein
LKSKEIPHIRTVIGLVGLDSLFFVVNFILWTEALHWVFSSPPSWCGAKVRYKRKKCLMLIKICEEILVELKNYLVKGR